MRGERDDSDREGRTPTKAQVFGVRIFAVCLAVFLWGWPIPSVADGQRAVYVVAASAFVLFGAGTLFLVRRNPRLVDPHGSSVSPALVAGLGLILMAIDYPFLQACVMGATAGGLVFLSLWGIRPRQ